MSAVLRVEERSQSGGTTITSRRDDLLAVQVLGARRPAPSEMTVQALAVELSCRGLSLGTEELAAIANVVLAAEVYRPSSDGQPACCVVEARD